MTNGKYRRGGIYKIPNPLKNCPKVIVIFFISVLFLAAGCSSSFFLKNVEGTRQIGNASWYGRKFHGKKTASGEIFNMYAMTAAHQTLPFGSKVRVTHLTTGKTIIVRINDRGPFIKGRIIDLSFEAAKRLKMLNEGVARVEIVVIE